MKFAGACKAFGAPCGKSFHEPKYILGMFRRTGLVGVGSRAGNSIRELSQLTKIQGSFFARQSFLLESWGKALKIWGLAVKSVAPSPKSTVTQVNRGSIFALRRSTLNFRLGGQRTAVEMPRNPKHCTLREQRRSQPLDGWEGATGLPRS